MAITPISGKSVGNEGPGKKKGDIKKLVFTMIELKSFGKGISSDDVARAIEVAGLKHMNESELPVSVLLMIAVCHAKYRKLALITLKPERMDDDQFNTCVQCLRELSATELVEVAEECSHLRSSVFNVLLPDNEGDFSKQQLLALTENELNRLHILIPWRAREIRRLKEECQKSQQACV